MLIAMLWMVNYAGTTSIPALMVTDFPAEAQTWLWLAFFASFAVKMPMWPVHTWLPDAHVQAPTAGSVILAGVLLKMGGYGFVRFSLPMFPEASAQLIWLVFGLSMVAVVYTSLVALVQQDMKKLIAYSSVAHMAFVTIGLFAFNRQGIEGALIVMLSHGLVSGALFLCVGVVYDRLHTREIDRYGGLSNNMPAYALLFMLFTMASVGLPGTSGFVGEFLALVGAYEANSWVARGRDHRHHPRRRLHALALLADRLRHGAQRRGRGDARSQHARAGACSRRSPRRCCGWASIPKASWRRCAATSAACSRGSSAPRPPGDAAADRRPPGAAPRADAHASAEGAPLMVNDFLLILPEEILTRRRARC